MTHNIHSEPEATVCSFTGAKEARPAPDGGAGPGSPARLSHRSLAGPRFPAAAAGPCLSPDVLAEMRRQHQDRAFHLSSRHAPRLDATRGRIARIERVVTPVAKAATRHIAAARRLRGRL